MPIHESARHAQAIESSSERQGERPALGAAAIGDIGPMASRQRPDLTIDPMPPGMTRTTCRARRRRCQ